MKKKDPTSTLIPTPLGQISQARAGAPRDGVAAQDTTLLRLVECQRLGQQAVVVCLHTTLVSLRVRVCTQSLLHVTMGGIMSGAAVTEVIWTATMQWSGVKMP